MSTRPAAAAPPEGRRGGEPFALSEALALRGWALAVLSGRGSGWSDAPPASAGSWTVFLAAEHCALLLRVRLGDPGGFLPPGPARLLDATVTAHQQSFLSAGATARQLSRWASLAGAAVVVLKSGVAAAEGSPMVGMADLDLLAAPESAAELEAHLKAARGYRTDSLAEHRLHGRYHGAPLVTGGMVPVEVHRTLKGFPAAAPLLERAVPLAALPGLLRLAPADHLFHQLLHGVVQHPERCGSMKDLVLLAHGWGQAAEDERAEVLARAAEHSDRRLLSAMLGMVEAAAAGRCPVDSLHSQAVGRYLILEQLQRWRPPQAVGRVYTGAAFALQGSGGAYRRFLREELAGGIPWNLGRWARRPLARTVLRGPALLLRASRLALVSALVVPYLARVRRALRDAPAAAAEATRLRIG